MVNNFPADATLYLFLYATLDLIAEVSDENNTLHQQMTLSSFL